MSLLSAPLKAMPNCIVVNGTAPCLGVETKSF